MMYHIINTSAAQTGIFQENEVSTTAADASAPYVARPSAATLLIL